MDHQRAAGPDRALKRLEVDSTSTVLDLGCGTGADLEMFARHVGFAVGLDRSMSMAQATRGRPIDGEPAVVTGDAHELPFAADRFDACWCRAVLLHTADPQLIVAEIARVVRPGGRVVLSEPDHGSHIVSTPETEIFERVKRHRQETLRNPLMGRRLAEVATTAGLVVTHVIPTPIIHRNLASARAAGGPFDVAVGAAVGAGAISQDDADRYIDSLEELDARDAFVFAGLAIVCVAVRPEGSD